MNDELRNISEVISKFNNDIADFVQKISDTLSAIEWPTIEWPTIDSLDSIFDRIKSITEHNSKYGWTLTGEIDYDDYFNDDLLNMSFKEQDQYFYEYYSKNDWEYLRKTQEEILECIDPKWCEIIEDCFESFNNDKYKVIIPTLISIIEGEISLLLESKEIGYKLVSKLESKVVNDDETYKKIAVISLYRFLSEELFSSHKFGKDRKELINRNWILHGRDDPKYWTKVDALRLINVLSSVEFVNRYIDV